MWAARLPAGCRGTRPTSTRRASSSRQSSSSYGVSQTRRLWRIVLSNTRTPDSSYGDFMAMYGSLVTGHRRLLELFDRLGDDETLLVYA